MAEFDPMGARESQESVSSDDYVKVEKPKSENSSPEVINGEEEEGGAGREREQQPGEGKLKSFEVSNF